MKHLFDFDPSCVTAQIKLAFAYTPKVLQNRITERPYTGLIYVVQGRYEYKYSGGGFIADAGSVIYLPPKSMPYSYHIFAENENTPVQTMQIEIALNDIKTSRPLSYAVHPTLLSTDAAVMYNRFEDVISDFAKRDAVSKLSLYAELFLLLAECAKHTKSKNTELKRKLAPALAYLQKNYTKPISVKTLADLCHISESQLRRLFHMLLGKSPIAYKNELISDTARSLLQSGEFSVGEISDMLGFYDIYAFSHFFSAAMGMSPTAYKKMLGTEKKRV